ncbi:MAG: tRNA (adenosine(37)-N6)-threonylcarbamoyltransferase complex dimerization subunit type 1 TsaB [Amaricoccus sp.]
MASELPLVLAFDTAAAHCAAALVRGGAILARRQEPMDRGQAERLMPMLEEMLGELGVAWTDLDGVGVATGPGNFTGLRLAVAAARGLAVALDRPAVGVTVFEAIAAAIPGPALVLLPDRPRGVFAQRFRDGTAEGLAVAGDPAALGPFDPATTVAGLDADRWAADFGLRPGPSEARADPAVVAALAAARLGTAPPPVPFYLRPPDAMPPREPATVILDDA